MAKSLVCSSMLFVGGGEVMRRNKQIEEVEGDGRVIAGRCERVLDIG